MLVLRAAAGQKRNTGVHNVSGKIENIWRSLNAVKRRLLDNKCPARLRGRTCVQDSCSRFSRCYSLTG